MGWNNEYGEPAIFKFEITPPFWQTWWFYALCIISVILFFFSLYRYRLKQILKIQAVRNRIATDLHDDIGSNLTTIGLLAELTQKDINDQNTAAKHLQRIAEEINESGQALDDIIWNINSRNDSLDEIIIRMRRYAAELFDHTATRCQLALQPGVAHIKVGMEQRRDLYLIYKESLNNIFKHAKAKNVEVELKYAGQQINLLIRDDGVGFDTNGESHRNGIKNFKLRVEKWNGSILISSRKNEGTTIDLEMPVA
jgi:signal transduction histidine kinase